MSQENSSEERNQMKRLSVNDKISHMLDYDFGRVVEHIRSSNLDFDVPRFFFDRGGKRSRFLDSQMEIIKRVVNPHSNQSASVKYVSFVPRHEIRELYAHETPRDIYKMNNEEKTLMTFLSTCTSEYLLTIPPGEGVINGMEISQCIQGEVNYEGVYPICKILNLPTGCGKTCIAVCGILQCIQSPVTQQKLHDDYSLFIERRTISSRGSSCAQLIRQNSIFLPNAILVYTPQHLVGVWRDTFRANVNEQNVEVFPKTDGLVIRGFDFHEIQRNPSKTYVFVVNHNSVKKFIKDETSEREFTYGAIVVDEAETCTLSLKDTHEYLPLAMYNLLVTATPHGIGNNVGGQRQQHQYLNKMFQHHVLSLHQCASVCKRTFNTYDTTKKERLQMVNYMADLSGIHVIPRTLYNDLVHEIQSNVPVMHSYKISCTRSFSQVLGLVQSDMQNVADAMKKEEERLGVKFRGNSIQDVIKQIDTRVVEFTKQRQAAEQDHQKIIRENGPGCIDAKNRAYNFKLKVDRLLFVRDKINKEFTNECGVCFEENQNKLYLTTCCAFNVCHDCIRKMNSRRCPMCRCESTNYAMLDDHYVHDHTTTTNTTTTNTMNELTICPRVQKNVSGFESWFRLHQFDRTTQALACDLIMQKASEYGLTHVIIAGTNVESWNILKLGVNKVHAFDVIRPNENVVDMDVFEEVQVRKKRKTVGKIDKVYKRFCSDSDCPQVLVLDMFLNKSAEVAGIDAKFTDLIIQVDTLETASDAPCNIQLAGRALRLGRNINDTPLRVVLGCC